MDIVTLLRSEHDRVKNLFNQFAKDDTHEAQRQLVIQLIQELSVHESAEESAVWPEVRKVVESSLILQALSEEQELKQILQRVHGNLEQVDLTAEIARIRAQLLAHVQTEEEQILPLITQKCDQACRDMLGTSYMDTKNALIDRAAKLNVTMLPETIVEQAKLT